MNQRAAWSAGIAGIVLLFFIVWIMYHPSAAFYSVLAIFTDAFIALGCMAVVGIPLSMPMIACVLTIMGFSINDSILLCGHIQEGWRKKVQTKLKTGSVQDRNNALEDTDRILRKSISELLKPLASRVILTSATTLCGSVALWVYGFGAIREFGIVLSTGVVFGLLSTVTLVAFGVEVSLRKECAELVRQTCREINLSQTT